jgi:adenylylsulfate kinase
MYDQIDEVYKILVLGLPGSGKTSFSRALCNRIPAVHFNADEVRVELNKDLGFSVADRVEQARRMGWLCDQVAKAGSFVIADFVCPIQATREAFCLGGPAYVVWIDRIRKSVYDDTNQLFTKPSRFDLRVTQDGAPSLWADQFLNLITCHPPRAAKYGIASAANLG